MEVLDIFSWLPAKEMSLEQLEKIFEEYFNGTYRGEYTISIEIEEDVMEQCMPKMIIQPLVENAVFHGLEPKEESGTVGVFV